MLRRGFILGETDRVLVVEDVLTTGGSTRETMQVATAAGGRVSARRRSSTAAAASATFDGAVPCRSCPSTCPPIEPDECPLCAQGLPVVKPGSRPCRVRRARLPTFKLTLAYDGTGFVGWQRQAVRALDSGSARRRAAPTSTAATVSVVAAPAAPMPACTRWVRSRASRSSRTIDGRRADRARSTLGCRCGPGRSRRPRSADDFHARFHARAKRYRYRIWNAAVLSPFERRVRVARADAARRRGDGGGRRSLDRRARLRGVPGHGQRHARRPTRTIDAVAHRHAPEGGWSCLRSRRRRVFCGTWSAQYRRHARGGRPRTPPADVDRARCSPRATARGRADRAAAGTVSGGGAATMPVAYNRVYREGSSACRLSSSWRGFRRDHPTKRWPGRSTSSSCRPTSPSSWTATAAGPRSAICRGSKATAPASTRCATSSKPRRGSASTC